jgi:hypothetical protein
MKGLLKELDDEMQPENSEFLFKVNDDDGSTAFALVAHG